MKKLALLMMCLSIVSLNLGCQTTKSRAVEGGVIGGAVGATAGGIIGHQSGHGGEGAGIGAAVGAVTGAIIGSQIAKPQQTTNQMTTQQIVDLTKQGTSNDVIIDRIRQTNSKFNLTAEDIKYLRQQGVSQQVIDVMLGL